MTHFTVEMLPAEEGDCLWIEYGDPADPHRVIIDGGTKATSPILLSKVTKLAETKGIFTFDLAVCTHIDNDHIPGLLELTNHMPSGISFSDLWFNGNKQLQAPGLLGVLEGEELSKRLSEGDLPWNNAVHGAELVVPDNDPLPVYKLPGGMELTLLSPTPAKLEALRTHWDEVLRDLAAKRRPPKPRGVLGKTPFPTSAQALNAAAAGKLSDPSPANGSSIAFLAEFGGKSCLFAADAHAQVLTNSLKRLCKERSIDRLRIDAFKISHHASKNNTSNALISLIECDKFLISTNGNKHNHPDVEAIARVLINSSSSPELHFDYRTDKTMQWKSNAIIGVRPSRTILPAEGREGLLVTL